jgi:hypothetical protein
MMPSFTASLANSYIFVVAAHSPTAAAELRKIGEIYGPRAAYFAAMTIADPYNRTLQPSKTAREQHCQDFAEEYPEAVPLLRQAILQFVRDTNAASV